MNPATAIKKITAAARYESRLALTVERRGDPGTYYRDRAAGMIAAARIIKKLSAPRMPRE